MLPSDLLRMHFQTALPYDRYAATGKPDKQEAWARVYNHAHLTDQQRALVGGFMREMKVLVTSGTWCGDCVQQCPLMARIAETSPEAGRGGRMIDLRFVDRDEHMELSEQIMINQGLRVPTVIFMAEDFEFVGLAGDRTLSRYRAVAQRQLGPSCPLPGAPVPREEMDATLQDWVDEFERVHLLLRLSTRLRAKHGD